MTDWQPIETAPKDGTIVLLREREWAPFHAYWAGGRWSAIDFARSNRPTHWKLPDSSLRRSEAP